MQGKNNSFTIINPSSVYISDETIIEEGVTIYPNNYLEGKCLIKKGATLLPNNFIINSTVGKSSKIFNSVIEESIVGDGVTIGPFSHLRPNSNIEENAKIGNFVEIKNSLVNSGTKINHLSYVGDAEIGKNVNVGCGVVFVNYNGKIKQKTIVEDKCFVGSSVNLIAPVKVGQSAFICAGTTVDKNVPANAFVIGRSRMNIKEERAIKYLKGDN